MSKTSLPEIKDIRYVTTGGITHFNMLLSEVMQRNNAGQTTANKMLQVRPVLMNKMLGLSMRPMGIPTNRIAWLVSSGDSLKWLVWFGSDYIGDTKDDGQGNTVPDRNKVRSACYIRIENAFEALEQYLIAGKLPLDVMPEGHLETLTG